MRRRMETNRQGNEGQEERKEGRKDVDTRGREEGGRESPIRDQYESPTGPVEKKNAGVERGRKTSIETTRRNRQE